MTEDTTQAEHERRVAELLTGLTGGDGWTLEELREAAEAVVANPNAIATDDEIDRGRRAVASKIRDLAPSSVAAASGAAVPARLLADFAWRSTGRRAVIGAGTPPGLQRCVVELAEWLGPDGGRRLPWLATPVVTVELRPDHTRPELASYAFEVAVAQGVRPDAPVAWKLRVEVGTTGGGEPRQVDMDPAAYLAALSGLPAAQDQVWFRASIIRG
jgi:hypothetical protein